MPSERALGVGVDVGVRGTQQDFHMLHDGRRWRLGVLTLTRRDDGILERRGVAEEALLGGQMHQRTGPDERGRKCSIGDLRHVDPNPVA